MFAARPCSVSSSPLSSPGWPTHSKPQRVTSSLKPSSQPSPPRPLSSIKAGLTTSSTGESQPRRTSPATASSTFMPRVGTTVMRMLPLSISIRLTPSCRPPCKVRMLTENGVGASMPSSSLVMRQFFAGLSWSISTCSQAMAGVARQMPRPRRSCKRVMGVPFVVMTPAQGS